MNDKKLYLFDFDGTLTHIDTLFDFLKFSFPDDYKFNYFKFIPFFILAKLKLKNVEDIKRKFIGVFLKGKSKSEIEKLATNYFETNASKILRKSAVAYVQNIHDSNDKYIVSASTDIWLRPFADFLGLKLICTMVEYSNQDIFTGNFSTPNCNYEEKTRRIQTEINLGEFNEILVFGDSKGDQSMSMLSTEFYYQYFDE